LAHASEIPISIGSLVDDIKGRESADCLEGRILFSSWGQTLYIWVCQ